ncbi:error-prone DNA polymerase [Pirellulaceae bacterium SH449]
MSALKFFELNTKSNFSFLEGASHPHELVEQAKSLGYAGIALTDRNSLAGVVRAFTAAKDCEIPFIVGSELHFVDGPPLLVWPRNRSGYGNLCKLLSLGRQRAEKGECLLFWSDLAGALESCTVALIPRGFCLKPQDGQPCYESERPYANKNDSKEPSIGLSMGLAEWLLRAKAIFSKNLYLAASVHRGVDDQAWLDQLCHFSKQTSVPLVATGDVLYHTPERMLLHDCITAINTGVTIEDVAAFRPENSQRHLRSLAEISGLYKNASEALYNTAEIAKQIEFRLDQLKYEYPTEWAPDGMTPIEYFKRLAWSGAKQRYPSGVPEKIISMLRHELQIIEDLHYEPYFLTVWDLVRFARSRNILCQGRGSAANSAVCFCIGVTSVDPNQFDLLFERFISRERNEAPDIDIDFEHQRREEVIQYIYQKYGRTRAGMTAAVTTYRIRSAIRDCGKAIGLSQDRIDRLAKIVEGRGPENSFTEHCTTAGIDPTSPLGERFIYLVDSITGFPRHLSQHTGGMVMTQGPLCELCPIENASMPDRTIIQWDKDDLDEIGILKVDCLALGMLSAIHRSLDLIGSHYQRSYNLATIPAEDPTVYDMICQADTVGVFQIESRAQMSMLPRLRPRCFYDLVIEVAIVRPGPIQGQMVQPYLKARSSGIQPAYPTEEIAEVLRRTMGVPIFQEQAMRLAVVAAGFTPGEADQLRRAMAAWRRQGIIENFRRKLIDGMLAKGLEQEFAERVFTQLRGFGEYGFPESHAASFALLVYASCWIKHHYPEVFCCAMLNSQPLGFYSPAQLLQDAQRHGVAVLPVDLNLSDWDCTLEMDAPIKRADAEFQHSRLSLRLGLRMIRGLKQAEADQLVSNRHRLGPYRDQADIVKRVRLEQPTLAILADSGALNSISGDRRAAYWQSLAREKSSTQMPLFETAGVDDDEMVPGELVKLSPIEEVYSDYATVGVSLQGHPMSFFREKLAEQRVKTAAELLATDHGRFVRVAGLIMLRQRPGTAKGITFVTMEDETGSINLVIKPQVWKDHYLTCKQSNAWHVQGVLEKREGVIHVVAARIEDLQELIGPLNIPSRDFR